MAVPFASEVFQIIVVSAFFVVLKGQTVSVNVQDVSSDPGTESATLRCDFGIDDPSYSFFNLEWRFGSTLIADFYNRATTPDYYDFCLTPGRCTATRTSSNSDLVLSSLEYPRDDGTYECTVIYDQGAQRPSGQDTSYLTVVVLTQPDKSEISYGGETVSGGVVELRKDIAKHIFTCEVQDVNPGANLTWTLDGQSLPKGSVSKTVDVVGNNNLITSTSNATLKPYPAYNGQVLECKAFNYEDDPGVQINVTLGVEDPCESTPCLNGGTCSVDGLDFSCVCNDGYLQPNCNAVPTTPPPEPTQPTCTDGKPITVPTTPSTTPPEPIGTDGKPTTVGKISTGAIIGIAGGCVFVGLCLIGIGIYLCYTYNCCIWCGEHYPCCREHCPCCRKPPKDRDENIGMNNKGDV